MFATYKYSVFIVELNGEKILQTQEDIPKEIVEHNYYVESIQDIKCKLDLLG